MKIRVLVVAALLIASGGCRSAAPIVNISNASLGPSPAASMDDVSRVISAAGTKLGWVMQEIRPGELTGTLARRNSVAIVTIRHDTSTFSIDYKDSRNLQQRDQNIHPQYNNWVQNLRKTIQSDMARPGSPSQ